MTMVDVHCHILPGIDDGPPDLTTSLEMARAAVESGITVVAATPHLRADFPDVNVHELAHRCQHLQEAITRAGIALAIVSGAEVSLSWALDASDEQLRLASYGQLGMDLLIETPSLGSAALARQLYDVRMRGYRVTLAHPERLSDADGIDLFEDLTSEGVLLQVNAGSISTGPRRSRSASLAHRLCRAGHVRVVASDSHRARDWRPITELASCRDRLMSLLGEAGARSVTDEIPRAVVSGSPLPSVEFRPHRPAFLVGARRKHA